MLRASAGYIDTIVRGGDLWLPLVGDIDILGLEKGHAIVEGVAATLPQERGAGEVEQVSRFARLAAENLNVSKPILGSIGSPVKIEKTMVNGDRT